MADNDEPQIYKKRYKIDKKLGAGNFGTAYLVDDMKAKNEQKVLKVVRLGEMDSEQTVDSVREAELLSHLDNEHIVKFHESFLENDCLCIVTEFCEGGDLDQRIKELKKQNQKLEEDQVTEWLIQILIAVQYIHKSRILHRDLKARNIFLKSNKIKIGDFGISRILVGTMDVATTFTGTPYYMSPEVMKHDGYEAKSDIWSVGCLLYEMCTFQHAFDGKGLMNVIYKVVEGKPPELPKTYSKELNDLQKKMFIKEPKNRPTAAKLLETPFLTEHRERTKLTGPLENTISGNRRSKEINAVFQVPKNYGQLKKQSWTISSKDYEPEGDDEDQSGNVPLSQLNEEPEEEEEEQTLKPSNTFKSTRQQVLEKRSQEMNARGQLSNQAVRSNAAEPASNRQMMRENPNSGNMKQSRPNAADMQQGEEPNSNRARNAAQLSRENKVNNRTGAVNAPVRESFDDRPITPMHGTFKQVADQYVDEDNPQYTNNRSNDRSPTREKTLKNQRTLSASQRLTMNSMSHTIDPRYGGNHHQENKNMSPSRTIGSATRPKPPPNVPDTESATLKDNPNRDAFGPFAKDLKINSLRTKAIQALGEATFEKVYNYLVKQRTAQKTDPSLDEAKIAQGLTAFVKKPGDCFLVDQLVFLDLLS